MASDDYEFLSIRIDDGPDIEISEARCIARVDSRKPHKKQWAELELFQTRAGMFVCVMRGKTMIETQHTKTVATLAENVSEIIRFFGYRWLAKKLYDKAGINAAIKVA